MTLYGYAGTILRIDLNRSRIQKEPLPADMAEKYLGGRGFVARMLFDEIAPGVDPDSEDNMFIAAVGPLTGHFLPASGKTHFGAKSPATGGYADSNMGGHFGPAMKYAGYDVLVLTGKAAEPSYLFIEDDRVEIRPAEKYWGQGSLTTERMLKDDLGEDFQILTIGPAGERKVRFACISHDFGRQAGRTGIGLVLGAKNIKAIAVKGTGSLPVFDLEGAYAKGKEAYKKVREKPGFKGWTPEGTAGLTNWANEVGVFPTRNFQTSYAGALQGYQRQSNPGATENHGQGLLSAAPRRAANTATPGQPWDRPTSKGPSLRPSPFSEAIACSRPSRMWPMPTGSAMSWVSTRYRRGSWRDGPLNAMSGGF